MSNVVRVLEAMACDVYEEGRFGSTDELEGLAPAVQAALEAGDGRALAEALGAAPAYACMILAPDNDEQAPEEPQQDDEPRLPDDESAKE